MQVATQAGPGAVPRIPLSRDRVLRAAVRLADEGGLGALTMRRLAEDLGAEAMSLYHHVASKDEILDGVVDVVAAEINQAVGRITLPSRGDAWKAAMRQRILTARQVLLRHPWAPGVFETRSSASREVVRYLDALLGLMRDGGFSYDLCHHALHVLGSRALGFAQEMFEPGDDAGDQDPEASMAALAEFPNVIGMMMEVAHDDPDSTLGWCDSQFEFEFGLDLILDGLDRLRGQA